MKRIWYEYPGDPLTPADLMTGKEFKDTNPGRSIRIIDIDRDGHETVTAETPVDEAICDCCNAEVEDDATCALSENRLYCVECMARWITPYIRG